MDQKVKERKKERKEGVKVDEGEKANAFRKKEMEQKQTPEAESSNFFCSQTHKFLQLFNHPLQLLSL